MNVILPIGSVVKLKKLSLPYMIFGFMQETGTRPGVISDYVGVPYPTGNIDLRYQIGFMMSEIEEVLFEGYKNDDFNDMKMVLEVLKASRENAEAKA